MANAAPSAEHARIAAAARGERAWRRWGAYLGERQWGTVREDYSEWGACWDYFPHDHARSRVYRWGEDGLLGICDDRARACFAFAFWNGRDAILKERLFGLAGPEGNHAEDCKELYYYVDATPTASYLKALYKYPQAEYPYAQLVAGARARGKRDRELELEDTGALDAGWWDVAIEYAKHDPDDILIQLTLTNRSQGPGLLHVLPTLWLRNTWAWNRHGEGYDPRGSIARAGPRAIALAQPTLGTYRLDADVRPDLWLFTDNEHNSERLWNSPGARYSKDAFHRRVIDGDTDAVNPAATGTKCAGWYQLAIGAGASEVLRFRLRATPPLSGAPLRAAQPGTSDTHDAFDGFDAILADRVREADAYHAVIHPGPLSDDERRVVRQADAGLVWSRKCYHFVVADWIAGDPGHPAPPAGRASGRNRGWHHVAVHAVMSLPDAWEYPWFAAWDLAFHCVAMARFDPVFAKDQLALLVSDDLMHASGQLPAYEFAFGDVNPPVHAWAAWRVYQLAGDRDRDFLARQFGRCLVNFTWWMNAVSDRSEGLFGGGFLGLDNVGAFDRGRPLPGGAHLVQADGTAWVAFFAATMVEIASELARSDPHYADAAAMLVRRFRTIAHAANAQLWDDVAGCYCDHVVVAAGAPIPIRLRSLVGILPMIAACAEPRLELVPRDRLIRLLALVLDERELLSPHGVRSLSRCYADAPYVFELDGARHEVRYAPGESTTPDFGSNSNWRGPVWLPINVLLIEALRRYHRIDATLAVECPTGSGHRMTLDGVADELERRLATLVVADRAGCRACHGDSARYVSDPSFRDLALFYEYFDGDTGRGCGASHQTGWSALLGSVIASRSNR